ncbi:hypothetical protein VUR80DRAFT_3637 [Thermomyces stellatus]
MAISVGSCRCFVAWPCSLIPRMQAKADICPGVVDIAKCKRRPRDCTASYFMCGSGDGCSFYVPVQLDHSSSRVPTWVSIPCSPGEEVEPEYFPSACLPGAPSSTGPTKPLAPASHVRRLQLSHAPRTAMVPRAFRRKAHSSASTKPSPRAHHVPYLAQLPPPSCATHTAWGHPGFRVRTILFGEGRGLAHYVASSCSLLLRYGRQVEI